VYKELDEKTLAGYCSARDRQAEDELYRRYAARLLTLCRRYCADGDDAKDLMQDAFIKALDRIGTYKYRGSGSLYAWISRIAVNMALNHLRRQKWRFISLDRYEGDEPPDPTEEQMQKIPEECLLKMISGLPDVRRTVFNLYCIDGFSHKEIGEMLGISEKGAASTLAKARRQLKEEINKYLKESDK